MREKNRQDLLRYTSYLQISTSLGYMLLHASFTGDWSRAGSQPGEHLTSPSSGLTLRRRVLSTLLIDLPEWPLGLKTSVIIYFQDTHIFFLPMPYQRNSSQVIHEAFLLSLAYLETQLHILFLKSALTGPSKVNMFIIILAKLLLEKSIVTFSSRIRELPPQISGWRY